MFVDINDNPLNVEILGDGEQTIIAHHGAPGLGSLAEPEASFGRLADDYRVVVFDARGSGRSGQAGPFTHEQWVADVEGLRRWLGVEQVIVAGGSYGGFIAMEYAARHPGRVSAVVLRDTSADNANQELAVRNAAASSRARIDPAKLDRIMSGTVRDDDDLRDCWREILPLYDHDYDPAKVEQRVAATPYHYETHNHAFAVNQPGYDIKHLLPGITAPTLITVGRHDWIAPVECSETIAALIPGAELRVFERSGHSPQVEEAELWEATVRDFLSRVRERA
ncbi:alpha/beta hydrolase [Nonomuraea sp. KC401]|uniref:alpha/beta fold hydrolase n=1 Tax=unclassified Nonomuraea TaxID=2593643 RepID=UPI0010FEC5DA|nr:alpha/beta hydrolase [Nonomuraea sp. KC401]NBE94875.1 alpha/beta fold hydrolase [Nonomuraea sp. K271]TLF72267.1 alpha/beta hydrolase [Nonomuraea sp. KC401]